MIRSPTQRRRDSGSRGGAGIPVGGQVQIVSDAHGSKGPFRYRLHGLTLQSELELMELIPVPPDDGTAADVLLRVDRTPEKLIEPVHRGVCHQARAGEMLTWLAGVARFHVKSGKEIVVE